MGCFLPRNEFNRDLAPRIIDALEERPAFLSSENFRTFLRARFKQQRGIYSAIPLFCCACVVHIYIYINRCGVKGMQRVGFILFDCDRLGFAKMFFDCHSPEHLVLCNLRCQGDKRNYLGIMKDIFGRRRVGS